MDVDSSRIIYKTFEIPSELWIGPDWLYNFWKECKQLYIHPLEVLWAYNIEIIGIEWENDVCSKCAVNFYSLDDYVEFCLKWM
jgi:hypothetical protein